MSGMTIQEFLAGLATEGIRARGGPETTAGAARADAETMAKSAADAAAEVKKANEEQGKRIQELLERARALRRGMENLSPHEKTESVFIQGEATSLTMDEMVQMIEGVIKGKLLLGMLGRKAEDEGDERFEREMESIFNALVMIENKFIKPAAGAIHEHLRNKGNKGDA